MEYYVGVSTEIVLQVDKFYTVVSPWSESEEGLQSETSIRKFFSLRCKTYLYVKLYCKVANVIILIIIISNDNAPKGAFQYHIKILPSPS